MMRWRVLAILMLASAMLVAITGHFGGLLVWGSDFFKP